MEDAFHLLSGGTLRTPGSASALSSVFPSPPSLPAISTVHTAADLPPSLDFFSTSNKQTKRRRSSQLESDEARGKISSKHGGKRKAKEDRISENEEKKKKRMTERDLELAATERGRCGVRIRRGAAEEAPPLARGIDDVGHKGLEKCLRDVFGFEMLMPVQRQVVPAMLKGLDVVAVAPTGSGKTLAYLIPMVQMCTAETKIERKNKEKAKRRRRDLKGVVLVPTRELSRQVERVLRRLVHGSGVQWSEKWIWIGTPMRLVKEIAEGLNAACVRCVILDEADKLIENAYQEAVDRALANVGAQCETVRRCMFSATLPQEVSKLADALLRDPLHIRVRYKKAKSLKAENREQNVEDDPMKKKQVTTESRLEHRFMFAGGKGELGKIHAMRQLLAEGVGVPMLVFVRERERASELMKELVYMGISAETLHGGLMSKTRANTLARFRAGDISILVATDLLARGVDFIGVKTVVSYDCPSSAGEYVHRAGRTARGGRQGLSVVLFTELDQDVLPLVARAAECLGAVLPKWMTAKRKKKGRKVSKRHGD